MRRRLAVILLLLALAPGMWLRDAPPRPVFAPTFKVTAIASKPLASGAVELAGAWRIESTHPEFGGYSALAAGQDGTLLALSDRGAALRFAAPGAARIAARIALLPNARGTLAKRERDCEAATIDPASGTLWAAYERSNRIVRFAPGFARWTRTAPPAMRGWPTNRGPEAMVRLRDGRFIVLSEAIDDGGSHRALLFAGDPVDGARARTFRFRPPSGFRPTDMAQLPDGRVLVLIRALGPPWRFTTALMVADPRTIAPGKPWRAEIAGRIAPPWPSDNYEGLAVTREASGETVLWLISDNNQAALVQRTLLLKLRWRPEKLPPARG